MLTKLKNNYLKNKTSKEINTDPSILLVEDDYDQMDVLVASTLDEIKNIIKIEATSDEQKQQLKGIKIISVSDLKSLKKVVSIHKGIFFTMLDCNIPDSKNTVPHDQFVKKNHKISGQHRSVDILLENLPNTEITVISSMNRFQKTVPKYYKETNDFTLNFIAKSDWEMISKNIGYNIRKHLYNNGIN